jgi:hypothetical protein
MSPPDSQIPIPDMRLSPRGIVCFATALAVLLAPAAVQAQRLSIVSGSRIRVSAPQLVVPVVGSYQAVRNDTLIVLEEGSGAQMWLIPMRDVQRVELFSGYKSGDSGKMFTGALWGGAIGAGAGLVTSAILQGASGDTYNLTNSGLVGLGVGAVVGALYGSRGQVERWDTVPIGRRVGLIPARRGIGAGLSIGF